jgi:RimJ/RimL family protein N-acetyltransferase
MTTYAPDWPLETKRLVLRPFIEDDYEVLYEMRSNKDVSRYLYSYPLSPERTRDFLQVKIAGASVDREGQWLSAAATVRETGELVADVALLWASEEHRQGEIGFVVHPAHQGKGYATEASSPLLAFGFERLKLHRIFARLDARNDASARVLEKLGMRREAHFTENEWIKGEWQSEIVYALLADEFRAEMKGPAGRDHPAGPAG